MPNDIANNMADTINQLDEQIKELEAKHWDECRQIAHYDEELKEAKRLLKAAVEDITFILSYSCSDEEMCCKECPTVNHACNKWRYTDEAEKLLKEG